MTPAGFPHSEIPGSKLVCSSPRLIAAYHVLHRLPTPRHPPFALSSLANSRNLGAHARLPHPLHENSKVLALSMRRETQSRLRYELSKNKLELQETRCSKLYRIGNRRHPTGTFTPRKAHRKNVVEVTGIEPVTYGLQSRRSPS